MTTPLTCLSSKLLSNLRARLTQVRHRFTDSPPAPYKHGQQRVVLQTRAEAKRKKVRLWNIKVSKEKLGSCICSKLLFIHAITGCDTTSRLYGIGKTLSKVQCSDEFTKCLCKKMPIRMISSALEKKHLSFSTMVIQGMTWMLYATNDSKKRW